MIENRLIGPLSKLNWYVGAIGDLLEPEVGKLIQ